MIERKTYDVLEWLGDVGGLLDMLIYIGAVLVSPIAAFTLKAELLSQIFRFAPSLELAKEKQLRHKNAGHDNLNIQEPDSELEEREKTAA